MTTDLIDKRLGEFEIVRELGRGGMGVVYEAVQSSLNRRVALKVLAPGLGLTPRAVQRFRREAESAAKLHHTNVVPVYAIGEDRGFHFYAMELIDGPSLDRVIADLRGSRTDAKPTQALAPQLAATGPYLDTSTPTGSAVSSGLRSGTGYFDTVARLVADVAEALDHAHTNGVIHRDIKPGNLLLGADGRLSINDFGLARALEESGMTTTGEFVGTPAYMAPEQIAGGRIPVDHRCDIYSLGATLYELLTLQPPFVADRRDQLLAMVVQKEPRAPRAVNPKVPRDLETICLKCLDKDPDRRYRSAQELADDLRRFVNRFAILAKRAGPLARAKKWVRRNPGASAAGLVVLLALGAAGYFAYELDRREKEQARAEELRRKELWADALDTALAFAMAGNVEDAEKKVREAVALGASDEEVLVTRGLIALYTGKAAVAVGLFHEACGADRNSVAARALLSHAYAVAMEWESAERELEVARAMPPRDARDKFFLGLAIGNFKPRDGLALMTEAEREGPIPRVGPSMRAEIRIWLAWNTADVRDAEDAITDVRASAPLLPNNPVVVGQRVIANLVACTAYRVHGNPVRAAEVLKAASEANADLVRFPPSVLNFANRSQYLEYTTKLCDVLELKKGLEAVRPPVNTAPLDYYDALLEFIDKKDDDALARLRKHPRDRSCLHLGLIIALTNPAHRASADEIWNTLTADESSYERLGSVLRYAPLFGNGREDAILKILDRPGVRAHFLTAGEKDAFIAFARGKLDDTKLVETMTTRNARTLAHYTAGLMWLARGPDGRDRATTHFRDARELMNFGSTSWQLSTAFLIRMNDPAWPSLAVPKKKP